MNFAESFNFANYNFLHHMSTVVLFVPATKKGDSTYSFKLGEWRAASEERREDCNSRLERRMSPLKKKYKM